MSSTLHGFLSYRSRDEIQEVRQKRDPINGFKDKIIEAGLTTVEEIKVCFGFFMIYSKTSAVFGLESMKKSFCRTWFPYHRMEPHVSRGHCDRSQAPWNFILTLKSLPATP